MFIESLGDALSLQQPISKLVGGVRLAQSIVDAAVSFLRRMAVKLVNGGRLEIMQNDFIAYLNSTHNLKESDAKALAESQALGPYFGELYERRLKLRKCDLVSEGVGSAEGPPGVLVLCALCRSHVLSEAD